MHTDSIRNVVKKVSQNALGSKVNPHELRHTYATQLIESGEDIMYVSEQMRHANIAITTEIYKHQVKTRENRASNNPIFSVYVVAFFCRLSYDYGERSDCYD